MKAALQGGLWIALASCATTRIPDLTQLASVAGVREELIQTAAFRHRLFSNAASLAEPASAMPVLIFLEGDGTPWTHGGRRVATDPRPRQPLAFHLFLRTDQPARYVTRPCYGGFTEASCSPSLWTQGRYSEAVIAGLADAITRAGSGDGNRPVILVGYSGGGALAALVAARLPRVVGIVTIAANLDVSAWTTLHGYLPLHQSLDPARQSPLRNIDHVLLAGGRDANVPLSTVASFIEQNPGTVVMTFPDFDHHCCWERQWPAILPAALRRIAY